MKGTTTSTGGRVPGVTFGNGRTRLTLPHTFGINTQYLPSQYTWAVST
jgi:hypothetical protein